MALKKLLNYDGLFIGVIRNPHNTFNLWHLCLPPQNNSFGGGLSVEVVKDPHYTFNLRRLFQPPQNYFCCGIFLCRFLYFKRMDRSRQFILDIPAVYNRHNELKCQFSTPPQSLPLLILLHLFLKKCHKMVQVDILWLI